MHAVNLLNQPFEISLVLNYCSLASQTLYPFATRSERVKGLANATRIIDGLLSMKVERQALGN